MSQGPSASSDMFAAISPSSYHSLHLEFNSGIGTAQYWVFNTVLVNKIGKLDFTNSRQQSDHKTPSS